MKMYRWSLLLALALSVAGCPPVSLYPLYEDRDIVRDDRLVGAWSSNDVVWTVRRTGDQYIAIRDEGELRSRFNATLTRLGGHLFLDLTPDPSENIKERYEHHIVFGHSISRVRFAGDTLELAVLTSVRPDSAQATRGGWISYEDEYKSSDDILITVPTERLRAFIQDHAVDPRLYDIRTFLRVP